MKYQQYLRSLPIIRSFLIVSAATGSVIIVTQASCGFDSFSADTAFDHLLEGLSATKHKVILDDLG